MGQQGLDQDKKQGDKCRAAGAAHSMVAFGILQFCVLRMVTAVVASEVGSLRAISEE